MKKESKAIERLCDPKSKVSAHYFIKNSGEVINLVPDTYEAWHAGESNWKNYSSLNKYSIGIEIHNPGHNYRYKNFLPKQINSLIKLLRNLILNYNINLKNILGHSDIAPTRKKDPGEKFPWKILAKKHLCHWHDLNRKKIKIYRDIKISFKEETQFLKNLSKIGYCKDKKTKLSKNNNFIIKAFQRRFRQDLVNGKIDKECLYISKNLLKE